MHSKLEIYLETRITENKSRVNKTSFNDNFHLKKTRFFNLKEQRKTGDQF